MSKERRSHREDKKKPALTPKEKKAVRKSRKDSRNILGEHGVHWTLCGRQKSRPECYPHPWGLSGTVIT